MSTAYELDEILANELGQPYLGKDVRIKKDQGMIGGDTYPGRFGVVTKIHPFTESGLLLYVSLAPTARAKARVEAFWLRNLIFLDETNSDMTVTPSQPVLYHVEIEYQKGSDFSINVTANTKKAAEKEAIQLARKCGWNKPIKKIIAKPQGN